MNQELPIKEVKWNDKRLLIRSVVFGLVFFGLLWALAMRVRPQEGFVFERVPAITGIYKCCEAGGRYSKSWVGGVGISCGPSGYFYFIGTNRNDCGLKEQLSGQPVEVFQALVPPLGARSPLVVKITSKGNTFYELGDVRLRELWISSSNIGAFTLAFILAVILHTAQLIYLNRNIKKFQGEKV